MSVWPRGGMVTQRIANPFIPVRFWAWPPKIKLFYFPKKSMLRFYSSVAQLVEQLTVNQLVAGSSPARGAKNRKNLKIIQKLNLFLSILSNTFLIPSEYFEYLILFNGSCCKSSGTSNLSDILTSKIKKFSENLKFG